MRRINLILAALVVVFGLAAVSFAQTNNNRWYKKNINKRQENQQERIAQGVKSGELTAREAARLEKQEVKLNREERRFRKSGDGLSIRERAKLERDLNRTSRHIYRQKHDKQDRP